MSRRILILGAGPAGLTSAIELQKTTTLQPLVLETLNQVGGTCRTPVFKGNRIDIGGHRYFTKYEQIIKWWLHFLPLNQGQDSDNVMIIRQRVSRIYFLRKFFSYPVSLSIKTLTNLGLARIIKIGIGYLHVLLKPLPQEQNMEDFFINRFGKELYETFFKDYTHKVWGIPCTEITPDWGAQRIKGLSVLEVITGAMRRVFTSADVLKVQDDFYYPKLGPGQMWERVAEQFIHTGGQIYLGQTVTNLMWHGDKVTAVQVRDAAGNEKTVPCDYVISTMPLKNLIVALGDKVPNAVREVAAGLVYRDFISVELVLKKLKIKNDTRIKTLHNLVPDNWIYVQERDVRMGRLQVLNNWSPSLPQDPDTVLLGIEYFCTQGDELWRKSADELKALAIQELLQIDMLENAADVIDGTVIKVPYAYPAYFGTYKQLPVVQEFLNGITNLFPVGRAGMHQYLNIDHAMLTAMKAVECIKKQEELKVKDIGEDVTPENLTVQERQVVAAKAKIWDLEMEGEYS